MQLETARLILRPFADCDAAVASYNSRRPIVARFMSDMVLETEEDALGWIRWINEEKCDNSIPFAVFAIVRKQGDECIGLIGVAPKWEIADSGEEAPSAR